MADPPRKRQLSRTRLPALPPGLPGRVPARGSPAARHGALAEDSIYTLHGYKAWAARVKAAWDAES
ncbi:MAG TPA: hypothetical protein VKA17_00090 [Gammaproteobacteria bacterium]|nr:hypothetical protein [Gammaproteobacteria bacterium]